MLVEKVAAGRTKEEGSLVHLRSVRLCGAKKSTGLSIVDESDSGNPLRMYTEYSVVHVLLQQQQEIPLLDITGAQKARELTCRWSLCLHAWRYRLPSSCLPCPMLDNQQGTLRKKRSCCPAKKRCYCAKRNRWERGGACAHTSTYSGINGYFHVHNTALNPVCMSTCYLLSLHRMKKGLFSKHCWGCS